MHQIFARTLRSAIQKAFDLASSAYFDLVILLAVCSNELRTHTFATLVKVYEAIKSLDDWTYSTPDVPFKESNN